MGNENSITDSNYDAKYNEEEFFYRYVKEDDSFLEKEDNYSASFIDLEHLFITNPEIFENKDDVIRSIINKLPFSIESVKPFLKKLIVSRSISKARQLSIDYIKPELAPDKDSFIFNAFMILLQQINNTNLDEETIKDVIAKLQNLTIGPNLCPPQEDTIIQNSNFTGITSCERILPHGISSNGHFLYVIGDENTIYSFPILENGALLNPISEKIVFNGSYQIAALQGYFYILGQLIVRVKENEKYTDMISKFEPIHISLGPLNVSDGISFVTVDKFFNVCVYKGENAEGALINTCTLHGSDKPLHENFKEAITYDMLINCPCETNGVFISFFLFISDKNYVCRMFSLLTGEHIEDRIVTFEDKINSICLDSIHNIHWVTTKASNNILVIKGYPYNGSSDPFIFESKIPNIQQCDSPYENILKGVNSNLICSLGSQISPQFIFNNETEFLCLISNILNIIEGDNLDDSNYEWFIHILQNFLIVASINIEMFHDNEQIILQLRNILLKLPSFFKNPSSLNIIGMFLLYSFDSIMCMDLLPLLVLVFKSINGQLIEKLLLKIEESDFFSHVPEAGNNAINKLLTEIDIILEMNPNLVSLLFVQQRVLVREAKKQLINDEFSSITIFKANIKATTPLEYLSEYMQVLINVFTASLNKFLTVDEFVNSAIFKLYNNFLNLILGVSKYHAISQITVPLLSVIPSALLSASNRFDNEEEEEERMIKKFFEKILFRTSFAIGILSATLIKGGNQSSFEKKNKWIIKPNMAIAENDNILNDILSTDLSTKITVSEEQMKNFYKFWKPAINRRLKPEVVFLDRTVMSIFLKTIDIQSDFDSSLESKKVSSSLRPVLDNLIKVRNHFIHLTRENIPTDTIIDKCKVLLNLNTEFRESEDIPKLISDFIISDTTSESIIHFITNQKIRFNIISIGFSFLNNLYLQKVNNEDFYHIIAFALSTIKTFDNLTAVIKANRNTHTFITKFLSNAIDVWDPYIVLVTYQILKSNALSGEEIGNILTDTFYKLMEDISSSWKFILCYPYAHLIPGATTYIISVLDDINSVTPMHLFILENAIENSKECSPSKLAIIVSFISKCHNKLLRNTSRVLYKALKYTDEKEEKVVDYIRTLFDQLGNTLIELENPIRACEYVTMFRRILLDECKLRDLLISHILSINTDSGMHRIAATFAILGGNIEVRKHFETVSLTNISKEDVNAVLLRADNKTNAFEIPFGPDTESYIINNENNVISTPVIPFKPDMFPYYDFVMSFFEFCCESYSNITSVLYIRSVSEYMNVPEFEAQFVKSKCYETCIDYLSKITNPFDTISELNERFGIIIGSEGTEEKFGFGTIYNYEMTKPLIISKPFKVESDIKFTIQSIDCFNGLIGLVSYDASTNPKYILLDYPSGRVYPSNENVSFNIQTCETRVFVNDGFLTINDQTVKITQSSPYLRIVIYSNSEIEDIIFDDGYEVPNEDIYDIKAHVYGIKSALINKNATLIRLPRYLNKFVDCKPGHFMKDQEIPKWTPHIGPSAKSLAVPPPPPFNLHLTPLTCNKMSKSVKKSALAQIFAQLFSQWGTVIITHIIAKEKEIFFPDICYARIFSILLMTLEPLDIQKLKDIKLPFSLQCSALKDHGATNIVNYNLTKVCKQALKNISMNENAISCVENYINLLVNTPEVHLLSFPDVPIIHISNQNSREKILWSATMNRADSLLITAPLFNSSINQETKTFNICSFDKNVTWNKISYVLPMFDEMVGLCIKNNYGSWIMSTPLEIILLIIALQSCKYSGSKLVERIALIEMVISQSPFALPFLNEIFPLIKVQLFDENDTNYKLYKKMIIILCSFLNEYSTSISSTNIASFAFQERCFLSNKLANVLCNYFPEFSCIEKKVKDLPDTIEIELPDLDFNPQTSEASNLFYFYSNIVTTQKDIKSFPYFELFPFWCTLWAKENTKPVEQVGVSITKISENTCKIVNPTKKYIRVRIKNVSLARDSVIMFSPTEDFDIRKKIPFSNIPTVLMLTTPNIYFRVISNKKADIDGLGFEILDDSNSAKEKLSVPMREIHDEFVKDVKSFVMDWNSSYTIELVSSFPSNVYEQNKFEDLLKGCLESPLTKKFSSKVIILYMIFIHRFNYLFTHFQSYIPTSLVNSVGRFISAEKVLVTFVQNIERSEDSHIRLEIDRQAEHKAIVKGESISPEKTIIGQVAEVFSQTSIGSLRAGNRPWSVGFIGEGAIDAGGPTRELFTELSESIFNPMSNLFIISPNERKNIGSNTDYYIPFTTLKRSEYTKMYSAIGHLLGIIVRYGYSQNLPFVKFVWKFIANEQIEDFDILSVDKDLEDLFDRLNNFNEDMKIQWSFVSWNSKVVMCPNKDGAYVKESEVEEFKDAYIQFRINEITPYLELIRDSFHENIGSNALMFMNSMIISKLAKNVEKITTSLLKEISSINNEIGEIFWPAVERMTDEQRSKLFKFITGLTAVPNSQARREFRFTVVWGNESSNFLPSAATCFNRLIMPHYENSEVCYNKLITAIEMCGTMEKG